MKKKIYTCLIFTFIATVVFVNLFVQNQNKNYSKITTIGQTENSKEIIFSTEIEDDNELYSIIKSVLGKYNGNLYCFDVVERENVRYYTKYILANDLQSFSNLDILDGRFFTKEEIESDLYLSTESSDDVRQIGVIDNFYKKNNFQIKTLKSHILENSNTFQKSFVLEMQNESDYNSFISELEQYNIAVVSNKYYSSTINVTKYLFIISLFTILVLLLIVFYDIMRSYKKIGIEKMLGLSNIEILRKRIVPIVLCEIILFSILPLLYSIFLFEHYGTLFVSFITEVYSYLFIITLCTTFLLITPFIYVKKISVSAMIKNKKPLKSILRFNYILKLLTTLGIVTVLTLSATQIGLIFSQKNDKFSNWEKIRDYAFVYELQYMDESFDSMSMENLQKWKDIYFELNRRGGLLADFSLYSEKYKNEQENAAFPEYSEIIVNPNYLKMFPIKSEDGLDVNISEDESDFLILVPERYKKYEKEITDYFTPIKNGYPSHSREKMEKQEIRIFWIKNNQEFFSMRLDVGTNNSNCIVDPLVRVVTESNGALEDFSCIAGSKNCPFKIKVDNYKNPTQEINDVFSQYYDLSYITFPTISIYKNVEEQISMVIDELILYFAVLLILMSINIGLIIQNITIYTEHNRIVLSVKKLLGYKYLHKHMKFFLCGTLGYVLVGIVLFNFLNIKTVFIFCSLLFLIEMILSVAIIAVCEKRNIIKVAKGG